ncbi:MAG: energy transducer TonB [Bacteroidia bacterium]|nr:energy transducer TonB [Bacteroidia bacterium]
MKTTILTIILTISFLYSYSQDKCATCDSIKRKSTQEYNFESYSQYRKECIIRDTIFYNQTLVVNERANANIYTINEKNYCGNYSSTASYEIKGEKLISGFSIENQDTIYWSVDNQEQQLQATTSEIIKHISKNTIYPKKCRKEKIEGRVYLTFVLNEDGNPINTYVIKGPDMLLNIEAVRVINSLQNITPIKLNGRPVKYKLNIPFNFKL